VDGAAQAVSHKSLHVNYDCSSVPYVYSRGPMAEPKLSRLELQVMEALWTRLQASIREVQESFPEKNRPAYTTVQTTVYRLEVKKAVRRVKKVGNFHIFEAAISRDAAQRRLIDDLLALFGGRIQPVMSRLIESGKLTLRDVREAEKTLRKLERKE
jgi:BlaI family transcriptional regulator, penicillinase repressor